MDEAIRQAQSGEVSGRGLSARHPDDQVVQMTAV